MGVLCDLNALLADLRDHLGFRRIGAGYRTLDALLPCLEALDPKEPGAGVLAGLTAQWVDAGWSTPAVLTRLLDRFPHARRGSLSLLDYLHLRMAEGVSAMHEEDFDAASVHFRFVQSLEGETADRELLAIANFWTGRCLRRMGQYDDAVHFTSRGEELALACGYGPMAAIMQSTLSWLAFQKGKLTGALVLLRRAEEALDETDDYLNRGNVKSAYGRIARRQGRYEHAVHCFGAAIAEYRRGGGGQAQLGRALSNLAFVKRVLALELQKDLDQIAASRRSTRDDTSEAGARMRDQRQRIERMRGEARQHMEEALAIYGPRHHHHGVAGVRINSGFLHLDEGELDLASADAVEAFRLGEEKRDFIIMARARTLQCMIEHQALEEQLGDPVQHHHAADTYAREAVHFAGQTQDTRLLARAYVWHGLTIAGDPSGEKDAAQRCYEAADELLQRLSADQRKTWDDLERLKAMVLRTRPMEPALRAWSAGLTGDKSFQEIEEEFACLVIPRVWEREGRKVARVAAKLSISPKKVRRILHSVGLLESLEPESPTG